MNAAHISYILYALSLGVVRLVFKLMLVEVGIKFDFMHIIYVRQLGLNGRGQIG